MITISYGDIELHPLMVLGYDWERQGRNNVHDTLAGQSVTLRPATLRRGTLEYLFTDEASALAAEDVHALADVFTLDDSDRPGLAMRYVLDGTLRVTLDPDTRHRFILRVGFRQVP
jgi:hypothetical protein